MIHLKSIWGKLCTTPNDSQTLPWEKPVLNNVDNVNKTGFCGVIPAITGKNKYLSLSGQAY